MELSVKRSSKKKYYILAFVLGLIPFLITSVSFSVKSHGVLYLYGDFNVQMLPFTVYVSKNVSNFHFPQFDFNNGAGLDFINAYTFYDLFSPFTFIHALFPEKALVFVMPFIMSLKFGAASMAAYMYISRFCKTDDLALTGGLLYAYSGFTMITLTLPYLDSIALFPFLLTALESAVVDKRRGVFGTMVFICAITQYYMFGMEAVFIIIYFFVRFTDKNFRISLKDFFCLAMETLLGLAAAGISLIPAVIQMAGSTRMGEPFSNIKDMLLYESPWRYPRIIRSSFMPPDLASFTSFFPDFKGEYPYGSRFSSISLYVPLFGMSGVIAYICAHKKSWQTKLTLLCFIIAFVPVLNSIFSMGSSIYYARWMFAPTLILCMMTACALENEPKYFKPGIIIETAVVAAITIFSFIFPMEKFLSADDASGTSYNHENKYTWIIVSFIGIILTFLMVFKARNNKDYSRMIIAVAMVFVFTISEALCSLGQIGNMYPDLFTLPHADPDYVPDIDAEDQSSRIMLDRDLTNINLTWGKGSSYCFTSIYNNNVQDYVNAIGTVNDGLRDEFATQSLMSVKTALIADPFPIEDSIRADAFKPYDSFSYYKNESIYDYFLNENYIPMGFCYDYCISDEKLLSLDKEVRERIMLKVMAVEDVSAVSDYLDPVPEEELYVLDDEEFAEECDKRAEKTVSGYYTDDDSYNAETDFSEPELVFFSVAYDEGFTAYVDGEEVPIIKANFGFQAIPVPAGKHTIKCVYHSKWRDIGAVSSVAGISGLIVYTVIFIIIKKKSRSAAVPNDNT